MIKIKKNELGLTLIELLVTMVLTIIIIIFTTSILIKSMENYQKIATENALRDEADLIMVKFYNELYTAKLSDIQSLIKENKLTDEKYRDSYIMYKEVLSNSGIKIKEKTGFLNEKIYFKNEEYIFQNPNIQLNTVSEKSSITASQEGVYQVNLVLYMKDKKKSITFNNEIRIINDKIKEDETWGELEITTDILYF